MPPSLRLTSLLRRRCDGRESGGLAQAVRTTEKDVPAFHSKSRVEHARMTPPDFAVLELCSYIATQSSTCLFGQLSPKSPVAQGASNVAIWCLPCSSCPIFPLPSPA